MNGNVELTTQMKSMLAGFIATVVLMLALPVFAQDTPVPPQGGFTGGVRAATGGVSGDGTADIITGAGPGGGPQQASVTPASRDSAPVPRAPRQAHRGTAATSAVIAAPDNGDSAALLLPAVQAAREAAHR